MGMLQKDFSLLCRTDPIASHREVRPTLMGDSGIRGPVAQLGARMTGSHEVVGSNPTRSTN